MSGGLPSTGVPNSTATIKYNGSAIEPGLSIEEQVARRRRDLGALPPQTPDLADIAARDLTTGRVRRARGGSMRDSIIGQAGQIGFLLLMSVWAWLGTFRGE